MLEPQILEQLKTVFEKLEGRVDLMVSASKHEKQVELLQMLEQVAVTSEKIRLIETEAETQSPGFHLRYNGRDCGIVFSGIPGGHEFTSLVLAILNADYKGTLPDQPVIDRIRSGKTDLVQLLDKLEDRFGIDPSVSRESVNWGRLMWPWWAAALPGHLCGR